MSKLRKLMATSEFELDQLAENLKISLKELAEAARQANEYLNQAKGTEVYNEFYDETIAEFKVSNTNLDKLAEWAEKAANTSEAY